MLLVFNAQILRNPSFFSYLKVTPLLNDAAYRALEKREEMVATPLERLIHTKWESAKISFHGPAPPSLNF
jgi:Domain of unknown function (DUF4205)